jgi:hypothetical protein
MRPGGFEPPTRARALAPSTRCMRGCDSSDSVTRLPCARSPRLNPMVERVRSAHRASSISDPMRSRSTVSPPAGERAAKQVLLEENRTFYCGTPVMKTGQNDRP